MHIVTVKDSDGKSAEGRGKPKAIMDIGYQCSAQNGFLVKNQRGKQMDKMQFKAN